MLRLEAQEKANEEQLQKIIAKANKAKSQAANHMSFREKSIQQREQAKQMKRALRTSVMKGVKLTMIGIGVALVIIALLAIVGCEMGVDGLKESFVCSIGKPPPDEGR